MKKISIACILLLGVALCPMAASRDKSRGASGKAAPVATPINQSSVKDTTRKTPDASKSSVLSSTPAMDTVSQKPYPSPAESTAALDVEGFIKPGEAVRIYAFPDTGSFVNGFYPVDGQGRIYLPIIGKMNVMRMTEKAFLDTLKAQYINYLRYPNLQVRHSIRISLLGGFQKPGLYYIDPDYSIWDAVYLAGGTTQEDGLRRMQWERDRLPVTRDIIPYYQSGQSLHSIGFQSGDQLWTPIAPSRKWWEVLVKDVLLGQMFPIITTSTSIYISYLMYKSYRSNSGYRIY